MKTEFYAHVNQTDPLLIEKAKIGELYTYQIFIYGNEGPIPHFHFEGLDGTINGAIRLDKPEYFKHTGSGNDKISISVFIEWIKSPHWRMGKHGLTNYQLMLYYWNDSNPDYKINTDTPMPNYEELR